jgi:hypothetical protein
LQVLSLEFYELAREEEPPVLILRKLRFIKQIEKDLLKFYIITGVVAEFGRLLQENLG